MVLAETPADADELRDWYLIVSASEDKAAEDESVFQNGLFGDFRPADASAGRLDLLNIAMDIVKTTKHF